MAGRGDIILLMLQVFVGAQQIALIAYIWIGLLHSYKCATKIR